MSLAKIVFEGDFDIRSGFFRMPAGMTIPMHSHTTWVQVAVMEGEMQIETTQDSSTTTPRLSPENLPAPNNGFFHPPLTWFDPAPFMLFSCRRPFARGNKFSDIRTCRLDVYLKTKLFQAGNKLFAAILREIFNLRGRIEHGVHLR